MNNLKTTAILLGSFLLLVCVCAGCRLWHLGMGVVDRQVNPDAIVSNYEWYEQQVKDIKAIEGQCKDAEDAMTQFKTDNGAAKDWRFDQRQEYARLSTNTTGLKQARRSLIENYNARAGMISRNLWKSSTLPQHLEE